VAREKSKEKRKHTATLPLLFSLSSLLWSPATPALDIDAFPAVRLFIDEMESRHGFAAQDLRAWFSEVEIREDILEAIARPKESLPWYEYRKLFVNDDRARLGLEFWKANAEALFRTGSEIGVPPEIVAAIIGVETRYGRQGGRYRVLDALTTLAFRYPERAEFFRGELVEALLLARELKVNPLTLKGSYAGAMGAPQFISSSYRRYTVDFDGDGRRDLTDLEDAIGSVANFLKQHGWRRDEPIVGEVKLDGSMYSWLENNGFEPRISLKHLSRYGILPVASTDDRQLAALLVFEGETGPIHRLGYNNFYVITRYNRSKNYALAVVELADELHRRYYGP
jgi:membrane-bound lytic murein transglycosylase B